ncbi:hypothetical protein R5R35_007218 [Gryllus longicercus]|uniref:Uncharacterized protein n=1 Tax=Gryllus longicercus TaxID=2509291 RepID=A0AAN9VL30_9ORTH
MADDVLLSAQQKGRSASVCAPGSSSMEAMAAMAAVASGTPPAGPDSAGGTPGSGRRRRPAARSQSARLSAGKSVRRRAAAGGGGGGDGAGAAAGMRSGASEPRLCDAYVTPATPEASPGLRRRGSSRRSVHHGHGHGQAAAHGAQPRKSMAFLDVPDGGAARGEDEDEDSYRLRSFSLTSKGRAPLDTLRYEYGKCR